MLYLAAPSILFLPLNNHIHYFFPCLHLLGTPGPLRQFFQMGFKLFEFFALTCDGNFISDFLLLSLLHLIFFCNFRKRFLIMPAAAAHQALPERFLLFIQCICLLKAAPASSNKKRRAYAVPRLCQRFPRRTSPVSFVSASSNRCLYR